MRYVFAGLTICLFSGLAQAGDVTVKGVHLCCGKCVTGATDALKDVNGITGLNVDKDAGSIVFQAENSEVAQNALAELAKAGFAGRATLGDEKLKLPKIGVKKGTTCNEFSIKDVHLCCGGCVNGVKEALEDVEGISEVNGDMKTGIVTVKGDNVDVRKTVQALRKAGFNGTPNLD